MKTYYIRYPRDFANEYDLCYCESKEEQAAAEADGWERVTRKYAEQACREELWRRKTDRNFSGYAPTDIIPFRLVGKDYTVDQDYDADNKRFLKLFDGKKVYHLNGFIWEV